MRGSAKLWISAAILGAACLTGCESGYVSGGYVEPIGYPGPYYDPEPFLPAPDIYVFGGPGFPHHGYAHEFSHRGFESRHFHDFSHAGGFPRGGHGAGHGGFGSHGGHGGHGERRR